MNLHACLTYTGLYWCTLATLRTANAYERVLAKRKEKHLRNRIARFTRQLRGDVLDFRHGVCHLSPLVHSRTPLAIFVYLHVEAERMSMTARMEERKDEHWSRATQTRAY